MIKIGNELIMDPKYICIGEGIFIETELGVCNVTIESEFDTSFLGLLFNEDSIECVRIEVDEDDKLISVEVIDDINSFHTTMYAFGYDFKKYDKYVTISSSIVDILKMLKPTGLCYTEKLRVVCIIYNMFEIVGDLELGLNSRQLILNNVHLRNAYSKETIVELDTLHVEGNFMYINDSDEFSIESELKTYLGMKFHEQILDIFTETGLVRR